MILGLMLTSHSFGLPQEDQDATGRHSIGPLPRHQEIDDEIQACMNLINASAASLAISIDGQLVYSKGYGFSDRRGRVPTSPRVTFRLASCTKPFTATAIQKLIRGGDLERDTLVYEFLDIPPSDELADPRIKQITVTDLLEHRGGWDREQTFDPMYQISEIKSGLKVRRVEKRHIVRYMWDRPLQHDPGDEECYSNFGYLLLGMVIEKVTGKSYVESIRELILEPIGADEISLSSPVRGNRKSREVYYLTENRLDLHLRDSASGLATNTETLCTFMDHYWMDGRRRGNDGTWFYYQIGTHPFCTTALMEQRRDGINFAILLNSRREEKYQEDNAAIRERFNQLLDKIKSKLSSD